MSKDTESMVKLIDKIEGIFQVLEINANVTFVIRGNLNKVHIFDTNYVHEFHARNNLKTDMEINNQAVDIVQRFTSKYKEMGVYRK